MKNKSTEKVDKIKTSFSASSITNYSGALSTYKFMSKLGLQSMFDSLSLKLGQ